VRHRLAQAENSPITEEEQLELLAIAETSDHNNKVAIITTETIVNVVLTETKSSETNLIGTHKDQVNGVEITGTTMAETKVRVVENR
jgi:hypothetical protein